MLNRFGRVYSAREIQKYFGHGGQIVGLRKMTYDEGRAKGLSAVECKTGTGFRFMVLPERGMDIGLCEYQGVPISFHSPVGESKPDFYDAQDDGWFWTWGGGLLSTCGLAYLGAPNVDQGEQLGLHGRVHNTPGEQLTLTQDNASGEMKISGVVKEAKMLGYNLVMYREIGTKIGENCLWIKDTVVNEGFKRAPHMMLYHVNIGHPILDAGSKIVADFLESHPRDDVAAQEFSAFDTYGAPTPDYPDTVFYHKLKPDSDGFCTAKLVNDRLSLGVYVKYQSENLPNLIQWKYTAEGMYATGLEPANCFVEGRSKERERGTLEYLEPGESRDYSVEIGVVEQ